MCAATDGERFDPMTSSKACIDQQDIERSLRYLPVYLAGCQGLLVIAGPTYATRLWVGTCRSERALTASPELTLPQAVCLTHIPLPPVSSLHQCVVELFVFLRTGGSAERVTVVPIGACKDDVQTAYRGLAAFDLRTAKSVVCSPRTHLVRHRPSPTCPCSGPSPVCVQPSPHQRRSPHPLHCLFKVLPPRGPATTPGGDHDGFRRGNCLQCMRPQLVAELARGARHQHQPETWIKPPPSQPCVAAWQQRQPWEIR